MSDRLLNHRRRTLSENPVQCDQVGGRPSQLTRYRGEIRGEPGDDSCMRFGHTAIVAANEVAADEYNYSSRPCSMAYRASSTRLPICNLRNVACTWFSTVR